MPDIFKDVPSKRVKIRWQGGTLDNSCFGPKGATFHGSHVEVDEAGNPIRNTEKRRSEFDFPIYVTEIVNGEHVPTDVGKKTVTFTDPLSGTTHTCSYLAVMNALSEVVSTEGADRVK